MYTVSKREKHNLGNVRKVDGGGVGRVLRLTEMKELLLFGLLLVHAVMGVSHERVVLFVEFRLEKFFVLFAERLILFSQETSTDLSSLTIRKQWKVVRG